MRRSVDKTGISSLQFHVINESKTVNVTSDGTFEFPKGGNTVGMDNVTLSCNVINRNKPLLRYIDVMRTTVDSVDTHESEFLYRMDVDNFAENCVKMQPNDCLNGNGYIADYNIWYDSTFPWIINHNKSHFVVVLLLICENPKDDKLWICSNTDDWDVGDDFVAWSSFSDFPVPIGLFGFVRAEPKFGLRFNAQVSSGENLSIEEIGYMMTRYSSHEYMCETSIPLIAYDTSLFRQKLLSKINSQ